MTASCIYAGTIRHRRLSPPREFSHRLALAYVDLVSSPRCWTAGYWPGAPGSSAFAAAITWARVAAIGSAVRDRVQQLSGSRPAGPIRLLTQLRSFGLCFNPVSFYYCFERRREAGEELHSVLAEVTNTPWGERHSYLLSDRGPDSAVLRGSFSKELHVSPFMGMDHVYDARATDPGATLSVHIESRRRGARAFDATLAMERRELTRAEVGRMTARHPLATLRVLALIYGHAVGLRLAGARVHPHPRAAAR